MTFPVVIPEKLLALATALDRPEVDLLQLDYHTEKEKQPVWTVRFVAPANSPLIKNLILTVQFLIWQGHLIHLLPVFNESATIQPDQDLHLALQGTLDPDQVSQMLLTRYPLPIPRPTTHNHYNDFNPIWLTVNSALNAVNRARNDTGALGSLLAEHPGQAHSASQAYHALVRAEGILEALLKIIPLHPNRKAHQ